MKSDLLTGAALALSIGAGSLASAASIGVNLTRSGAPSESGFTNWVAADNSLPSNLTIDDLTLSVVGINAGTTLRSINRDGNDGYTGILPALTQTWWGQRQASQSPGGFITIDISGLAAGDYTFTSWHLDHQDQTGEMKIEFSNNNGATFFDAISPFDLVSVADDGATAPIVKSFNFTSTGSDVQFRFRNTAVDTGSSAVSGVFPVVNGFSIATPIPEPGALVLGLAGLTGLALRRRRTA